VEPDKVRPIHRLNLMTASAVDALERAGAEEMSYANVAEELRRLREEVAP
jgi:hypothetical protein